MTGGHSCVVQPIRTREYSPQLTVDVSRIVAYRCACSCGWRGPSRQTVQRARFDYLDHEHAHSTVGGNQ